MTTLRLEQVFFHLPRIDPVQVIIRDAIDDAEPEALIKRKRIGVFDGNMQMDAASSPLAQTSLQCAVERVSDRFSAELRKNFNGDKFSVARRMTGATASLQRS